MLMSLIDFFLHIDAHLANVIAQYGTLTYAILFVVIFCETGLVVTPILPGDSLLFAAGAFAARGSLNVFFVFALLSIAAIVGDAVNYAIGAYLGPKVFTKNYRFLNQNHLKIAEEFYAKHGNKTIVMARFVPIVRTLAPFLAGVSKMSYPKFASYNIVGGLLWVALCVFGGYFFGNIPFVEKHFSAVILVIIVISILPGVIHVIREKRKPR